MNAGGWILLLASWSAITTLVVFCLIKVLRDSGPVGGDPQGDDPG